ncbi:Uncharacterised protein [Mycobacteroides abscessus subsp. abscessus]|nr:Uncharacterised protein [Mycobacteroides abscessus subsp. abscessus]
MFAWSFCTNEIDSTPPPIAISMPSSTICLAAVAMAIRPDAHCRSTLMPDTELGSPARSSAWRAMLNPVEPCCMAAPSTTSSTSPPSIPARDTAWAMACPASSCAWVLLNAPRYAFPIGVRAVETMTASRMSVCSFWCWCYRFEVDGGLRE